MGITAKILVVEDEIIIGKEIKMELMSLGYSVTAVVATGEKAIQKASETRPDLVLMDIKLKGDMDGIEAAEQIRSCYDIPVIYLTAHSDDNTLQRAKITEPFGYLLKPFEEKDLYAVIEMALYKHKIEKEAREQKIWINTILNSIGDGVIATDNNNQITFINPVAEALTGWRQKEVIGKPLNEIFKAFKEVVYQSVKHPYTKESIGGFAKEVHNNILIAKDGKSIPIDSNCAPMKDNRGIHAGKVLVFRDISERKQAKEALLESQTNLQNLFASLSRFLFLLDSNKHIMYAHHTVLDSLGYTETDMRGKNIFSFCSPDDSEKVVSIFNQLKLGKDALCNLTLLDKYGNKICMKTKVTSGRLMNKNVVYGISREISESMLPKKVSKAYWGAEEKHF